MKTLNLEALLNLENKKTPARVPVNEIERGAVLYIMAAGPDDRDLCETQWGNYRKAFGLEDSNVGLRKFLVAWCLVNEDNEQLIAPGPEANRVRPEFIEAMNKLAETVPMPAMIRLYETASQKMGFSKEDEAELVKNSETTPSDDGSGTKRKQPASVGKRGSKRSKTSTK